MKHIKTFDETNEELRRDKITWHGPGQKDRKPGVKAFKGSKDYKEVRHQSAKGDRQKAKLDIKKGKVFEDKISLRSLLETEDPKIHDFFKDVENIRKMADEILMMDPDEVASVVSTNQWVLKNIGESKNVIEESYNFLWSD